MTKAKPMPARTLKALKASIVKWRKNEEGDFQGVNTEDCPLCKIYLLAKDSGCDGCPVAVKIKASGCYGTPYDKAYFAKVNYGQRSKKFKAAAKAEREFLESLLPKGEKA